MGDRRAWVLVAALSLAVTACNGTTPEPTLAPGTTATTSTSTFSTTTAAPTTSEATTTTAVTPTTEDPDARRAEIQALVEAAVIGRLQAQHDEDAVAMRMWVGSQDVYDRQLEAFGRTDWEQRPSTDNYVITVDEVLLDRADCVVTLGTTEVLEGVIAGVSGSSTRISIWWPAPEGHFQLGAAWEQGTPRFQWIEECDIAVRGVAP